MYDFDRIIDRKHTSSFKWDCNLDTFGTENVLPMWVADMDFKCPDALLDALRQRLDHGILGYTSRNEAYVNAITNWMHRRHNWDIDKNWITYCSPGVMPGICILISLLTEPGDEIVIQTPNYSSLMDAIKDKGRIMLDNPLLKTDEGYKIDFDYLNRLLKRAKMLLLCNPNNPTGTVWSKNDLEQLGNLCLENDVFVISDEVHCDLTRTGIKHTPFGSLSKAVSNISATCISPNKTFNVGGVLTSTFFISNEDVRNRYNRELSTWQIRLDNVFGRIAVEEVYSSSECERWLDALLEYLDGNVYYAVDRIKSTGKLEIICPDATYLLWIDFSSLGLSNDDLRRFLIYDAHIGLSDGLDFSPHCDQFMRMNVACPRAILEDGLNRLVHAINKL